MPIVTIQSVNRGDAAELIEEIRTRGAEVLGCSPDNLWVVVERLEPSAQSHPPIVTIRANEGRPLEIRGALARRVAEAVGRWLAIPAAGVWVHYQEMKVGDIWFG